MGSRLCLNASHTYAGGHSSGVINVPVKESASNGISFKKEDLVWYLQRDGSYTEAKVIRCQCCSLSKCTSAGKAAEQQLVFDEPH